MRCERIGGVGDPERLELGPDGEEMGVDEKVLESSGEVERE